MYPVRARACVCVCVINVWVLERERERERERARERETLIAMQASDLYARRSGNNKKIIKSCNGVQVGADDSSQPRTFELRRGVNYP